MTHEALVIPLMAFAVRRFWGGEDSRFARAHMFDQMPDGAVLTGAVAPLDDHQHAGVRFDQIALKFDELDLQRAQRALVIEVLFGHAESSHATGGAFSPAR